MKTPRLYTLAIASSISIFINAQNIEFEEIPADSTNFIGVSAGSVAFADVDNDNDLDVVISGALDFGGNKSSTLYLNSGTGSFSAAVNAPFADVDNCSIAFADVDGDNDQDLLIAGRDAGSSLVAKLYTNDGNGIFTEVMGTPFVSVEYCSVAFADIDNDNDLDVLIVGKNASSTPSTKLYTNDGSGVFTDVPSTGLENASHGAIAFADVDNDNDQDVLITGYYFSNMKFAELYINDGSGTFTASSTSAFEGITFGSVAFADIDNDNDQDVLITGFTGSSDPSTILYENDGSGIFTVIAGTPFPALESSTGNFGDFDGDNDQDLIITGYTSNGITEIYENDGSGSFTEVTPTTFIGVSQGSVAIANVDGQSLPEILLTGYTGSSWIAKLYTNPSTLGFEDMSLMDGISIYPNPSTGSVNIDIGKLKDVSFMVFDVVGQLVHKEELINSPIYQFELNEVAGMYLVELSVKNERRILELFIQ